MFCFFVYKLVQDVARFVHHIPFAQALHDAATLNSKMKLEVLVVLWCCVCVRTFAHHHHGVAHTLNQAFALQLCHPEFSHNIVVCLGLEEPRTHQASDVAETFRRLVFDITELECSALVNNVVADGAAQAVARELGFEEQVCLMHSVDKVPRYALGLLKGKSPDRQFTPASNLIKKIREVAKALTNSDKGRKALKAACNALSMPHLRFRLDKNETRIASVHGLLLSYIRLHKPLMWLSRGSTWARYDLSGRPVWYNDGVQSEEFQSILEIESILNSCKVITTVHNHGTIAERVRRWILRSGTFSLSPSHPSLVLVFTCFGDR